MQAGASGKTRSVTHRNGSSYSAAAPADILHPKLTIHFDSVEVGAPSLVFPGEVVALPDRPPTRRRGPKRAARHGER